MLLQQLIQYLTLLKVDPEVCSRKKSNLFMC